MATTSLGNILNAATALADVLKTDIPGPTALRFSRVAKWITEEYDFFNALRDKMIKKHGENVKGTDQYRVPPATPAYARYLAEIEALLKEEVTVPYDKIRVEDFDGKLTAGQILAFEFILDDVRSDAEKEEGSILNRRAAERARRLEEAGKADVVDFVPDIEPGLKVV